MRAPAEPVQVIGAGLGGLTAALALLRSGWRTQVCEQAAVLGEVGAGITLSPGACRGLASLGLGPALLAASLPVPDIAFLHHRTGELLAGVLRQGPPPDRGFETARHIHRADLHSILLGAIREADPGAVLTGKRLVHVDGGGGGGGGGVSLRFADGSACNADLVIGADGARSAVRRAWFDESLPTFAGQVAYRCLIPAQAAAPHLRGADAAVFIGAARVFNRYKVRRGEWVNVIGIARSNAWREEGWNTPATVAEFQQEFAGFHADVLALIGCAPAASLIKWGLFVRPPLPGWSRGPVVLLGDAAHPILPFLGLGAALAIEDGIVLARALGAAATRSDALRAFQRARTARVEEVRRESIRQGEIIQASNPDDGSLARSPSQRSTLFDYDPCTVRLES